MTSFCATGVSHTSGSGPSTTPRPAAAASRAEGTVSQDMLDLGVTGGMPVAANHFSQLPGLAEIWIKVTRDKSAGLSIFSATRSEERRVGKACRVRVER